MNVEFPVTVKFAFPKSPIKVTFPSLIAVVVPVPLNVDKFKAGVPSKFVIVRVPLFVIFTLLLIELNQYS